MTGKSRKALQVAENSDNIDSNIVAVCHRCVAAKNSRRQNMTLAEKKQLQIIAENQELTSLRDFLLPMLMNGQVGFK